MKTLRLDDIDYSGDFLEIERSNPDPDSGPLGVAYIAVCQDEGMRAVYLNRDQLIRLAEACLRIARKSA